MNLAGLKVMLDGLYSYFKDKQTGNITNIDNSGGKSYFDVWTDAPKSAIKPPMTSRTDPDAMEVDAIRTAHQCNRFWILGADEELDNLGFKGQEHN